MRHRRWVLLLAFVLVAVVPLVFVGLRVASRHPAFRRAVAERLMPDAKGRLSIGELEVGLASVRAADVRVELEGGGFVEIPRIALGVSWPRLVASGFNPAGSLGSAVVSGPRIVIALGAADEAGTGARFRPAAVFDAIPDRVSVSDASITFIDTAGWSLGAHSLDLVAARGRDGRVAGEVSGSCLGARGNLTGAFAWDRLSRSLSVTASVADGDLSSDGLVTLPRVRARPLSGRGEATLALTTDGASTDWNVSFGLRDADLAFAEGETLRAVSARGSLDGDVLSVTEATGAWRSSDLEADGAVSLARREFDGLRVTASGLPLDAAWRLARGEHGGDDVAVPEGTADLVAALTGAFGAPVLDLSVSRADLTLGPVSLSGCAGSGRLGDGRVEVDRLTGEAAGGRFSVAGSAGRRDGSTPWTLDVSGEATDLDLSALWRDADPSVGGRVSLGSLRIAGTTERPSASAEVAWRALAVAGVQLRSGRGDVVFDGDSLTVDLRSDAGTYAVVGSVTDLTTRPALDVHATLSGFAADSTLVPRGVPLAPTILDGSLSLRGPLDGLTFRGGLGALGGDLTGFFALSGTLSGGPGARRMAASCRSEDATLRGVAVPLSADVALDREALDIANLVLANAVTAHARIGLRGAREIEGEVVVSQAALADILRAAVAKPALGGVDGALSLSATLGGTVDEPRAEIEAAADGVRIGGVGGLGATLSASVAGKRVALRAAELLDGGTPALTASGEVSLDREGEVSVSVRGRDLPGRLLGGSDETRFDVTAGIGGTRGRPSFDALVESSRGEFLGIPFDRLAARVTGAEGAARVEPLALERSGRYRLSATGLVPYEALLPGGEAEASLTVEVGGDPLALLMEVVQLADVARGEGTLNLHLVGNRDGVSVAHGELEARARSARPRALFDEITDLAVSVAVVDGEVTSGAAGGRVEGRAVRLESVRGASPGGEELPALEAAGIDLGALALFTDPAGIKLRVPGLMQPGHVGHAAARGRDGAPAFLIAGPSDQPVLRGEIELSDMTFTYPFLEGGIGVGGDFLSDAEWDVRIIAGRNLWYRRADATLHVERGGSLDLVGVPSQHTLCVAGRVAARRGTVGFAGAEFDVQKAVVEFPAFCEPPRFTVEASTRVEDGTRITLSMDSAEGDLMLTGAGVTLDESSLVLRSDAPEDDTREKVLSRLQYGIGFDFLAGEEQASLERKQALDVVGSQIGGQLVRPLLSPIEARVRRNLRLDLVRIEVEFVGHFLSHLDEWRAHEGRGEYLPFLADTRVTLGKYVSRDWLLSYVGRAEAFEQDIGYQRLGLRHELGVEYEVSPHTSLSLRVVYDPRLSAWDRGISIENRFEF